MYLVVQEEELYEIDIPLNFVASVGTRVHGLACWFDVLFNGRYSEPTVRFCYSVFLEVLLLFVEECGQCSKNGNACCCLYFYPFFAMISFLYFLLKWQDSRGIYYNILMRNNGRVKDSRWLRFLWDNFKEGDEQLLTDVSSKRDDQLLTNVKL